VEDNTTNFLIAAFGKAPAAGPNLTVLHSSTLTLGATNSGGTVVINGATNGANVRVWGVQYGPSDLRTVA